MIRGRKQWIPLTVILLCMFVSVGLSSNMSHADWAHYAPDEMEEQADLIVLGTIEGPIMEKETAKIGHSGYTDWEVTVKEYLKTSGPLYEKIVVTTPGNRTNTGVWTSIDYALDEQGSEVLIFIERSGSTLRPLTPNAVIGVYGNQLRNIHEGEEKNQLQTLLNQEERFPAERGSVSEKYEQLMEKSLKVNQQKLSATALILISVVVAAAIGIIIALLMIYARRRTMT